MENAKSFCRKFKGFALKLKGVGLLALVFAMILSGVAEHASIASAASATGAPDPAEDRMPASDQQSSHAGRRLSPAVKRPMDRSGRTRVGKASFYATMFAGRKMADGTPMRPSGDNAASLTLPLGTTAKVTNLETGKVAVVTIRDRGPYVAGRIVDLSPATAREIGLDRHKGVTRVEVAPIAVPLPDGKIKLGDGILASNNAEPPGIAANPR